MKKMGRFERLASAKAVSQVVYQAMPAAPIACGLAPRSVGRGPCAWVGVQVSAKAAVVMSMEVSLNMV